MEPRLFLKLWFIIVATGVIVAFSVGSTFAETMTWNVPSGDWSDVDNWGGTKPGNGDYAVVSNGGTVSITQEGEGCDTLVLGNDIAESGAVNMTEGSLSSSSELIGFYGTGTFSQTGGTNYSPSLVIGGESGTHGEYYQTGGTMIVISSLDIATGAGSSGTYYLSGGTLDVSGQFEQIGVGGTGVFMQDGGTNQTEHIWLGESSGASGTYNQSGGTITVGAGLYMGLSDSEGTYNLSGGGILDASTAIEWIDGTASFSQFGGTNYAGAIYLGISSGSDGTYTQSGGTAVISGDISLGYGTGAVGTYTLNGGYLRAGSISNGSGMGSFSFSGGILSVDVYNGDLEVLTGGTVAPGNSPGTQVQNGDITFYSGAVLDIEIGGLVQGTEYDWLDVNGGNIAFNAGSRLKLTQYGYMPSIGDYFDVITWDSGYTFTDNGLIFEAWDPNFSWAIYDTSLRVTYNGQGAVPEPATVVGLLLATAAVLERRRSWMRRNA